MGRSSAPLTPEPLTSVSTSILDLKAKCLWILRFYNDIMNILSYT